MTILNAFDGTSEEVIRANQVVNSIDGFPETVIVTYSRVKLDYLLQHYPCDHIATLNTAFAPIRICRVEDSGVSYAAYHYLAPSAYVDIPTAERLAGVLQELDMCRIT